MVLDAILRQAVQLFPSREIFAVEQWNPVFLGVNAGTSGNAKTNDTYEETKGAKECSHGRTYNRLSASYQPNHRHVTAPKP
jgi:hypothetical protein